MGWNGDRAGRSSEAKLAGYRGKVWGARSSPKGRVPMHSSKGWEVWHLEGWASLREIGWVYWQAWEQGGPGDWDPGQ